MVKLTDMAGKIQILSTSPTSYYPHLTEDLAFEELSLLGPECSMLLEIDGGGYSIFIKTLLGKTVELEQWITASSEYNEGRRWLASLCERDRETLPRFATLCSEVKNSYTEGEYGEIRLPKRARGLKDCLERTFGEKLLDEQVNSPAPLAMRRLM